MSAQIHFICKQAYGHTPLSAHPWKLQFCRQHIQELPDIFTTESHPCFLSSVTRLAYSHHTSKNSSAHLVRHTVTVQCNTYEEHINTSIFKPKTSLLARI